MNHSQGDLKLKEMQASMDDKKDWTQLNSIKGSCLTTMLQVTRELSKTSKKACSWRIKNQFRRWMKLNRTRIIHLQLVKRRSQSNGCEILSSSINLVWIPETLDKAQSAIQTLDPSWTARASMISKKQRRITMAIWESRPYSVSKR